MSSLPSKSNEAIHAPFIENLELFPEDSGMEEDLEQIWQDVDACIAVVMVFNERRWMECEDYQQKEEEKQIQKEKEDCKKEKLASTHKTHLEVSVRSMFFVSVDPFQFLKNQKSKRKSEWVGIGRVRSLFLLFQNLVTWLGFDL